MARKQEWVGRMSYQGPGWGVMWTLSIGDPQKSMTCPLEVVISPFGYCRVRWVPRYEWEGPFSGSYTLAARG